MNIKTILVDDERKALENLKSKIERFCPDLEIIGETQNPEQAIEMITNLKPDLVFMDVAMPKMSGFDVLAQIPQPNFELVFATAFDQYAIEAIRHCAIGYLLKPVGKEDLIHTVDRALESIREKQALEKNRLLVSNLQQPNPQRKKIAIQCADGLDMVKLEDIVHCEGVEGYTRINLRNKKPILNSKGIGHYRKLLEEHNFFMVHKSHLINLDYVEKYLSAGYVQLIDKSRIPVSRNRKTELVNKLRGATYA